MSGTADLQVGETGLENLGKVTVKLVELINGTRPEPFGFVPDFPVFYAEMKSVAPALVVMADDVACRVRPFVPQLPGDGAGVVTGIVVFDGGPQTVNDLSAETDTVADVFIRLFKVVVPGIFRIQMHERKNHVEVNDPPPPVFEGSVVKSCKGTFQLFVQRGDVVHDTVVERRRKIAAVEGLDFADNFV